MPASGNISLVCNYCGAGSEPVSLKSISGLTDWFVLSPAQSVGEAIGENSIVICRKCKLHIDELGRIVRWRVQRKLKPPSPDDLLPEEDLPDSSFIQGIPDPHIACIGIPHEEWRSSLPVAMRFVDPSWTKKPAVKEEEEESSKEWM